LAKLLRSVHEIAATVGASYAVVVRRSAYKYWSVALVLICRLVFGEFAHAMPHEETPDAPVSAHCGHQALGGVESADVQNDSHDSRLNCCENGMCDCPCVHVSALDAPRVLFDSQLLQTLRAAERISGLAQKQLTPLLRPPA
jgi:hypothetical protein